MNPTKRPVLRLTSKSITKSFLTSNKKHLILTGTRGIGKTTLAHELAAELGIFKNLEQTTMPAITTHCIPRSHVELHDHISGNVTVIGRFFDESQRNPDVSLDQLTKWGNQMKPIADAFRQEGVAAIEHAIASDSPWVFFDEFGYLESCCPEFQAAVQRLFEKKRVLAILRKESTGFLNTIFRRDDIFLYNLDSPVLPVGCVIMASGIGKRFGSNKLMADFNGKPLIAHILEVTGNGLFANRVVVTRHKAIQDFCTQMDIPVILHDYPSRNDTVRLGLSSMIDSSKMTAPLKNAVPSENPNSLPPDHLPLAEPLAGCMFTVGDAPLVTRESLESLVLTFSQRQKKYAFHGADIVRLSWENAGGNPILFGNNYFRELLHLPEGKGGGFLLKQYSERVTFVEASFPEELWDIDTKEDLENVKKRKTEILS